MQDVYLGHHKTLPQEFKDPSKWRDNPCSLSGIFCIVTMTILSKLIYSFIAISIIITTDFLNYNLILNVYDNTEAAVQPSCSKRKEKLNKKFGEITLPDIKT